LTTPFEKGIISPRLDFFVFLGKVYGTGSSPMKLTRRQETFIRKLLDLYHETEGPIHYSALADHLGVSRITAYDMLRHLEEKGFVSSQYHLQDEKTGPGRSKVLFTPTALAHKMLAQVAGPLEGADWEKVKERVINNISPIDFPVFELKRKLFDHILDEEDNPIRYCIEVMSILLLHMRKSKQRQFFIQTLPLILPPGKLANRSGLNLIMGFTLGLLADESVQDQIWSQELLDHVKQVQSIIAEMDDESCLRFTTKLTEVFTLILE
jgi:DNA-binding MarR family transcriptional regulator